MSTPNAFAEFSIFKSDTTVIDFMHLVRQSDGSVLGWIDENGYPQGTLANSGGGSSVFVNGSLVTNPNLLQGVGISFSVVGSNVTMNNTGVLSFNGLTGNTGITSTGGSVSIIQVGNNFDLEVSGSGAGVLSLNTLIGDVDIASAGAGIGVTISGQNVLIQNSGVTQLVAGTGISASGSTGSVTVTNSGVTSLIAGPGIIVSNPTGAVTVSSTQGDLPWVDIQNYGGIPKSQASINATTTVNTTASSPNIVVGSALPHFLNGSGVCIWKAGAATTQTTPSAPTITSPAVTGSQTIKYKIIGVDALSGLTAASVTGSVTNAPTIFGSKTTAISSITATAGVVTVNFTSSLNNTVSPNMTIHIVGVTGGGATWNGIWTIATAPTTSQITYALLGASGSGTVTGATGRVSNTQLITAVSRNSSGVISVTTSQPHNFNVGTQAQPTIVILEGISTVDTEGSTAGLGLIISDLCGHFVIVSTPTNTTFTCNTANIVPTVGILNTNTTTGGTGSGSNSAASATVWEFNYVSCPALSGTTVEYYVYSDNAAPGGTLNLIGKTLYGEHHFTDWGPNYGGGFLAPTYVPTTPPGSAQNQMFSTTILSGGGTTSMVLAANVPSAVTASTIMYDDGPCLVAAANALPTLGGQILLSPPDIVNSVTLPMYIFNSPITIPAQRELVVASALIVNETVYLNNYISLVGTRQANWTTAPSFSQSANPIIFGLASPMFQFGTLSTGQITGINIDGIGITCTSNNINGQYGISILSGSYVKITNSSFVSSDFLGSGTNVPLMFNGSCDSVHLENITYEGASVYGDEQPIGQSCWGPHVGNIVFHASDNASIPAATFPSGQVYLLGVNTSAQRGIMLDGQFGTNGASDIYEFNGVWNQAPTTPAFMFYGFSNVFNIIIKQIQMDSESTAVLANWSRVIQSVKCIDVFTANSPIIPVITGNSIQGLTIVGSESFVAGQVLNTSIENYGQSNIGSVLSNRTLEINNKPQSLGRVGTIFAPLPIESAAVSAVSSGIGTFAAGTYNVSVTAIGWDGGESAPSQQTQVTVNGSQGIQVSWTLTSGFQGYYVYIQKITSGSASRTTTMYTTSPQTFTSLGSLPTSQPFLGMDGTGLPLIEPNLIITPQLILPSGINKLTVTPPTMTGNRTVTFADGSQSTVVATSLTTTSGGSPYTVTLQGATTSSHISITPTNAAAAADQAAGQVYVSSKGTNQVVIATGATSGEQFDILATVI